MKTDSLRETIKRIAENGKGVGIRLPYLDQNLNEKIATVLQVYLQGLKKGHLLAPLTYCVNEMSENAMRAHIKHIYFTEKKLNIYDPVEYDRGMQGFRDAIMTRVEEYIKKLNNSSYEIKISFLVKNDHFVIRVKNVFSLSPMELSRARTRIEKARACRDLAEMFSEFQDETESMGIGIATIFLMLRRLGVDDEGFSLSSTENGKGTLAEIRIPLGALTDEDTNAISDMIAEEIDVLPRFPSHEISLREFLSAPSFDMAQVTQVIKSDPGLCADVIRMVNSSAFGSELNISSIPQAIKLLGQKDIRNLLLTQSKMADMTSRYKNKKVLISLWGHSERCAFLVEGLTRKLKLHELIDEAFLAGILHDIGKIALAQIDPSVTKKISKFCSGKGVQGDMMEHLSIGTSHAAIGASLTKKWNLPEGVTSAVLFHHKPYLAPKKHRTIVNLVYLANVFCNYQEGTFDLKFLDEQALEILGIGTIENAKRIFEELEHGVGG